MTGSGLGGGWLALLAGPLGLPLDFARGFGKTGQARECARPYMGIGCSRISVGFPHGLLTSDRLRGHF